MFRDLSLVSNDRLAEEIIALAQSEGIPTVLAGITLPETAETTEMHARIQRIQDTEAFDASTVSERILYGASATYSRDDLPPQTFKSLDDLLTKKGSAVVRPDTMNAYGLQKPEQVLLLRAAIIATTTREYKAHREGRRLSDRQAKIQRQALFSLRHMATNVVAVNETVDERGVQKFLGAYAANYLARSVLKELHEQGKFNLATNDSVDAALRLPIAFGQLASGDQSTVVAAFPPGARGPVEEKNLGFKAVIPAEIDAERIERLREMQWNFGGPYTEFRYYESIKPFGVAKPRTENADGKTRKRSGPANGGEEEQDRQDHNYLILEVRHPDETGAMKTHVIADHPVKGNACYALREEVIDEWERLLGIRLSWRDVFSLPRGTAKQLGARKIIHAKGTDVEARVRQYLMQDRESMVYETFGAIFDREAGLFTDDMQPTEKNQMPGMFIRTIRSSRVLANSWQAIREYGYESRHRTVAAAQKAIKEAQSPRERQISLVKRAEEIFAWIVANEFD